MKLVVNPNRMELIKLRRRLLFAYRGHKLLKDKEEELMHHFMRLIGEITTLRQKVETQLIALYRSFLFTLMYIPRHILEFIFSKIPENKLVINYTPLLNLKIPIVKLQEIHKINYGLSFTTGSLDYTVELLTQLWPLLIKLAEKEKCAEIIAYELQTTRRRVNALEYVLIPSLKETIKHITSRLNELERENITRLLKIQELIRST